MAVRVKDRIEANVRQSDKVNSSLSIQLNSGTATVYNGSANKSINITPANINAVNKNGDSISGTLFLGSARKLQWSTTSTVDNNSTGCSWYGLGTYVKDGQTWLNLSNYYGINITTNNNNTLQHNGAIILDSSNYNNYAPTKTGGGASGNWAINITGHAARASADGNGANIANTYLKLSGGTLTGTLKLGTSTTTTSPNTGIWVHDLREYTPNQDMFGSQSVNWYFYQVPGYSWRSIMHTKGWYGTYAAWDIAGPATDGLDTNFLLRSYHNTSASNWLPILHSENYTNYTVTKTGSGASGTWGINITGNAASATKATQDQYGHNISVNYLPDYIQTVDLTSLNVNTWYPVTIPIPKYGMHHLACVVQLDSGTKPSWSSHTGGFTAVVEILALQSGWGTTDRSTIVLCNNQTFLASGQAKPVGYTQFYNSSLGCFYLRGGAKYNLKSDFFDIWTIHTASVTIAEEAVAPLSSYPDIALEKSTIIANLNGNATTATCTTSLGRGGATSIPMTFYWSGQGGQPTWLWGGNDGTNMYVYNPANFNVAGAVNADKLDGYHGSFGQAVNTYVLRDGSGYIYTNYINSNTGNNENPGISQVIVTNGSDGFYRKASLAHLKNSLGSMPPISHTHSYLPLSGGNLTGLLTIYTSGKYITLGCQNAGLAHYSTNADSGHWFNKDVRVQGNIYCGSSYNSLVLHAGNYSSYALPLSGGYISGTITKSYAGTSWIGMTHGDGAAIKLSAAASSGSASCLWSVKTYSGAWGCGNLSGTDRLYFVFGTDANYPGTNSAVTSIYMENNGVLYGAAWNDYAEFRPQNEELTPGYIVYCDDDGKLKYTTERLQKFEGVVSDTYGFAIGQTDECKTPLAVSGRVLVYTNPFEEFHAGDCVCAGIGGVAYKMTREEIMLYPDRIVGIVSEIPKYKVWGTGNVEVDGRIWIKVR